jgi:predicted nucleotidyltransferase
MARHVPEKQVIDTVREALAALQAEGLDIIAAYLYGSQAAGTADQDSDIDVAVISPTLSGNRIEDWCRLNRLSSRRDARIEIIGFRPEQFRDEHPLAWQVRTTGVRLR